MKVFSRKIGAKHRRHCANYVQVVEKKRWIMGGIEAVVAVSDSCAGEVRPVGGKERDQAGPWLVGGIKSFKGRSSLGKGR